MRTHVYVFWYGCRSASLCYAYISIYALNYKSKTEGKYLIAEKQKKIEGCPLRTNGMSVGRRGIDTKVKADGRDLLQ